MEDVSQQFSCQYDRFEQLQRAQINFGKASKKTLTISYIEARLQNLEDTWLSFKSTHEDIVKNVQRQDRKGCSYFEKGIFYDCEELYLSYKGEMNTKLAELQPPATETSQTQNTQFQTSHPSQQLEIKLPVLSVPKFSGSYTDWPSFHDIFETLIHNNSNLNSVQKLHYLKTSLSGDAELLLKNITITNQNYTLAWETLKKRYGNKRYIVRSILKSLFSIPKITESATAVRQLLDKTSECLSSLKNIGVSTQSWDPLIEYLTVTKLDTDTHKQWEQRIASSTEELPSLDSLFKFLESRFHSLEMIHSQDSIQKVKSFHTTALLENQKDKIKCVYCSGEHYLYNCKLYGKLSYNDKLKTVQDNALCFNCLAPGHSAFQCKRESRCRVCKSKHHSTLHIEKSKSKPSGNIVVEDKEKQRDNSKLASHFANSSDQVLLATALVDIITENGPQVYRSIVDPGSQASLVSEYFVQSTGLKTQRYDTELQFSEGKTLRSKFIVEFEMRSRYNSHFALLVRASVVKHVTTNQPQAPVTIQNWPEIENKSLADPEYNRPGRVDILLSGSVHGKIMLEGLCRSPEGTLAQNTQLGWIISGDTSATVGNSRVVSVHACLCESTLLKQFWEMENEFLPKERKLTAEEKRCEEIFKQTTTRTDTGRYKVKLPFKEGIQSPVEKCGNTKDIAIARMIQLERKFKRNTKLKDDYTKAIKEYIDLGHMTTAVEDKQDAVYLPHHAVIREDKQTTKTRVVMDASCKGSLGYSLNDTLLTGPTIQADLRTLLLKWRTYKVVLVSDIVKMFKQVLIADEHADYQRIIWRDNPEDKLQSFKLLTVTFGTASAPYLAIRTMHQLAEDEGHKFPIAAEVVKNSFYVDDLMSGSHDVESIIEIYHQVNQLLQLGGFELQKWSSNSKEFLDKISGNKKQSQDVEIKFDQEFKILGITWNRCEDKFKITVNLGETKEPITKRKILSDIAKLFDPFGWLAPVVVLAKIFMQKLWLCTASWDDQLPKELVESWLSYRRQLQDLEKIMINRWIHTHPSNTRVEIHGFADASNAAYAAVLYTRVVNENQVVVSLLESKTKVAPVKQISIAKLELCGAVLLARLLSETREVLNIPVTQVYAYTDSMVVLAWLQAQPNRWQTFVANRVAEIQTRLDNDRWSHVKSEANPADLASRGVDPSELVNRALWWQGPQWLQVKEIKLDKPHIPHTNLEEKKQKPVVLHITEEEDILERFSSLNHMTRVLSYCRRFLRLRDKAEHREAQPKYLTTTEMKQTLNKLIQLEQDKHFKEEIEDLNKLGRVKQRSALKTLSPYMESGIMRVGGRLRRAQVAQELKHPIILPKKSYLTKLIVRDAHLKLLHGGNATTANYVQSKYWVLGLTPLVRRCIRQCVVCVKHRAQTAQPRMGDLPFERVHPRRAFEVSGVDLAGPIQMRTSKGRGHKSYKGYICLFVCFFSRAVHLEAVSDLTSQGFLAAFRRFVARRGHVSDLWSDNGTNFVGAARELEFLFQESQEGLRNEIAELLANDGTTWHFIPPRAPNFGGLWEAGIKSVKASLTKVIGNSTLTFEEMSTLLTQIEACLNSRPMTPLKDDPTDVSVLTPAHFLIGEPLVAIPEEAEGNVYIAPLERWKLVQRMTKHFWKRWSAEYLHTLQQRHKWQGDTAAPRIGDIVLVKDECTPPTKWMMAEVVDTHPGTDSVVRVVTLRGKNNTFQRPISKLVALPLNH